MLLAVFLGELLDLILTVFEVSVAVESAEVEAPRFAVVFQDVQNDDELREDKALLFGG